MAKVDAPYKVLVRDIPVQRTFEVPATDVEAWLRGLPTRDALGRSEGDPDAGQGTATLDLYADGTHVFVTGPFKGRLQVACSRCVEPVTLVIDEPLRVTYMPKHEMPVDDDADEPAATGDDGEAEGAEVGAGDLDLFPYDNEVIDLEPLFREQFVLAVPYAPLCREDCKGLCPQCGIDRNSGTCECQPPIDPRLAALKGLKLPS